MHDHDLPLKLIAAKTAAAVPHFAPGDDGTPAPGAAETPATYLAGLAAAGHLVAALDFLAAALPRREAVWWACRCARSVLVPAPAPAAEAALVVAEAWTVAPGDRNRRQALVAAEAATFGDPAGCIALGVFLSGGSLVPPHLKEVPPPEHAFARAIGGALGIAATRVPPVEIAATRRAFLDLGLAVARGEDRWKPSL